MITNELYILEDSLFDMSYGGGQITLEEYEELLDESLLYVNFRFDKNKMTDPEYVKKLEKQFKSISNEEWKGKMTHREFRNYMIKSVLMAVTLPVVGTAAPFIYIMIHCLKQSEGELKYDEIKAIENAKNKAIKKLEQERNKCENDTEKKKLDNDIKKLKNISFK